jgi:hypothetical protein
MNTTEKNLPNKSLSAECRNIAFLGQKEDNGRKQKKNQASNQNPSLFDSM